MPPYKSISKNFRLLDDLHLNPLCTPIIGFKNTVFKATRSQYISFKLQEEQQMAKLLLQLSQTKLTTAIVESWPELLFQQLVSYGLFKPLTGSFFLTRLKNFFTSLLNENRATVLNYKNKSYVVTSFIFMAFTSQKTNQYIQETVALPFWYKRFCNVVFQLVTENFDINFLQNLPNRILKLLLKHGVLVHKEKAHNINSFFHKECFVNNSLFELIPKEYPIQPSILENIYSKPKVISRIYTLDANGKIPTSIRHRFFNPNWIESIKPNVFIEDAVTKVISMYWLEKKDFYAVQKILENTPGLDFDLETQKILAQIHAIESEENLKNRKIQWDQKREVARQQIHSHKYLTLQKILNPLQLAMLRKYIRYLYTNKYLIFDKANGATKNRYWQHRDDFTFYVQQQICDILNQILLKPVKIGHNAITLYKPGATLPKHTDDVLAFSWVMSLVIDMQPEKTVDDTWPIYVEIQGEKKAAFLEIGDGHLINPQMPHWREELKDHYLGILFLWFVPLDFKGYVNGTWID